MATITFDGVTYFCNGEVQETGSVVGYTTSGGAKRYVARYSFTTPSEGGNHISFSTANVSLADGSNPPPIRFFIGTVPDSHINAGEDAEYHGTVTITKYDDPLSIASGELDILLLPNTTYYLWFFPGSTNYGYYYWYAKKEEYTFANVSGAAGLVKIDTGSSFVNAIPYIDTGSEWKQAIPYIDNGNAWQICG